MSLDTLLDAVAPFINSVAVLDVSSGDLKGELNAHLTDENFVAYGTVAGDDAKSLNYNNMLLSLSSVGSSYLHHFWEVGCPTPCMSQACRAQNLKIMDPVLACDHRCLLPNSVSWFTQQLLLSDPC